MASSPSDSNGPKRVLLKRAHSPFQADVWRLRRGGVFVVRKSFERQSWPVRKTIGIWITSREIRNLRSLQGIEGIPRFIRRPAPWALDMTWMEAQDLPSFDTRATVTAAYFDALDRIVKRMHARGISHGDLRRRNLLHNPETGQPVVLDFAQSINRSDWLLKPILPLAFRYDRVKLLRLREWYIGSENLTPSQLAEFKRRAPVTLRLGRYLRRKIYRPLKYWYLGKKPRNPPSRPHGGHR